MRLSLQWKILAGYLAVAGVGLGVAGWLSLERLEASDMKQLQAGVAGPARLAREISCARPAGGLRALPRGLAPRGPPAGGDKTRAPALPAAAAGRGGPQ